MEKDKSSIIVLCISFFIQNKDDMRRERSNLCWKVSCSSFLLQFFIAEPNFFYLSWFLQCAAMTIWSERRGKKDCSLKGYGS